MKTEILPNKQQIGYLLPEATFITLKGFYNPR